TGLGQDFDEISCHGERARILDALALGVFPDGFEARDRLLRPALEQRGEAARTERLEPIPAQRARFIGLEHLRRQGGRRLRFSAQRQERRLYPGSSSRSLRQFGVTPLIPPL